MSITQDLRLSVEHRDKTRWQLIRLIGRLEQENSDSACRMIAMTTEIEELKVDRDRLADKLDEQATRASEEIRQLEQTVRLRDQQIDDLQHRLDVGVKAEHIIAATQELSVDEIQRHCTPIPLWQSPLANPANVPPWTHTGQPHPAT